MVLAYFRKFRCACHGIFLFEDAASDAKQVGASLKNLLRIVSVNAADGAHRLV